MHNFVSNALKHRPSPVNFTCDFNTSNTAAASRTTKHFSDYKTNDVGTSVRNVSVVGLPDVV